MQNRDKTTYLILFIIISLSISALLFYKFSNRKSIYEINQIAFSTFINIKVETNKKEKKEIINEIINEAKNIGNLFDYRIKDSYTYKLNKNKTIKVPTPFLSYFNLNKKLGTKTNNYFNPLVGNLFKLYNNFEKGSIPPSENDIGIELNKLKNSDYKIITNIETNYKNSLNQIKLFIKNKKVFPNFQIKINGDAMIDLGGSLKGLLIDYIYHRLEEENINSFLINIGGDIKGKRLDKDWKIAIQHPKTNIFIGETNLNNASIVTSGNYERFFMHNGKRYSHLINPFTGKPDSNLASVTIISEYCLLADIYSTAIFTMSKEKAINFIKKNKLKSLLIWFDNNNKISYYNNSNINIIDKGK